MTRSRGVPGVDVADRAGECDARGDERISRCPKPSRQPSLRPSPNARPAGRRPGGRPELGDTVGLEVWGKPGVRVRHHDFLGRVDPITLHSDATLHLDVGSGTAFVVRKPL
jgi:hypothetical protein